MTLNETVAAIAEAIREKTGKSELIKPVDFAEEIKSISVGGGESGDSEYEYFALTDGWDTDIPMITLFASLVKGETSTLGIVIFPVEYARLANEGVTIDPLAVALDMSLIISAGGQQMTLKDTILASGTTEESLAKYRITKEQFYDLNA